MTEQQEEYITDALEMMGQGYDQPAAIIESQRKVLALSDKGLVDYQVWGWVKISAKFIAHIKLLRGAKLAIWQTMALSIDENGECSLSANEIAKLTGYSRSEVIESQKELDEMGYLTVTKKSGKRNIYRPEFAARGANTPTTEPKNDQSRKTTSPVSLLAGTPDQSSPSIVNSTPSINRVKRVKQQNTQVQGIEAAMFQNRTVTESDLENKETRAALETFERDMQLPGSWQWYPAKASKEREWKAFREFIVKLYRADPKAFEKYNTWRNQPYVKGAKSNTQIKDYPADFEVSWSDYLRANDSKPAPSGGRSMQNLERDL